MYKGISNFSEEIYCELFRKNNEIQMKRMFSTSSEKPKSLTARSLQKKICKVSYRVLIEVACFFFTIDCLLLLKIFYRVNLEIQPFYKFLIYKFHLFLSKAIVAIHKLLFYSSFEATWLMSQPSTCLNISRLPLSKWLKSCFLTEEEMQLGLLFFHGKKRSQLHP